MVFDKTDEIANLWHSSYFDGVVVNNNLYTHLMCRTRYKDLGDEAIVVNVLAVTLLALMIVMPVVLLSDKFRARNIQVITVHGL